MLSKPFTSELMYSPQNLQVEASISSIPQAGRQRQG